MPSALRRAACCLLLGVAIGCDLGESATDPSRGPELRLLGRFPDIGDGVSCAPADPACGVPRNASVRVKLDRLLLPASAVRQSVRIVSGASAQLSAPFFSPRYDLLSSELAFDLTAPLEAKTLYRVELLDGKSAGIRLQAFDGAPLAEADRRESWSFATSARTDSGLEPQLPAREPTCEDIAVRLGASCSSSACHGGVEPVLGLSFESVEAMKRTALERVARQTETGDQVGVPLEAPARFGVAMPIIARGAAHNSYLVYKLLLEPANLTPCAGTGDGCEPFGDFPGAAECVGLPAEERRRIADWFVPGHPMPPPRSPAAAGVLPPAHTLDCGFMRALTRWIDAGAPCD